VRVSGGSHPPAGPQLAVRAVAALAALAVLAAGCISPAPEDGDTAPTPTASLSEGPRYAAVDGNFCTSLESEDLAGVLSAVTPGAKLSLDGVTAPDLGSDSPMTAHVGCRTTVTSNQIHTSGGEVALMIFHDPDEARTYYHRGVEGEMRLLDTEDAETVNGPWDEATNVQTVTGPAGDELMSSSFLAYHGNMYVRVGYHGTIQDSGTGPDEAVETIRNVAATLLEHAIANVPCEERCS
jgi:hypothetical protein